MKTEEQFAQKLENEAGDFKNKGTNMKIKKFKDLKYEKNKKKKEFEPKEIIKKMRQEKKY